MKTVEWPELIHAYTHNSKSRDSSVDIALGYGLDDRNARVRFPAGAGSFPLHHRVQNGSGAHSASYPMGTWVQSGWGVKLVTHFHLVPRSNNKWSYTSSPPIRLCAQLKYGDSFTFTFYA
jgi:hypothetical protein